ncbi:MAG: hypothetical protein QOG31_234 [Thermoplasmata archaeon]|jgi:hypothetical protein|nr:hypothetical protein [Thermoplasmata archaeon]
MKPPRAAFVVLLRYSVLGSALGLAVAGLVTGYRDLTMLSLLASSCMALLGWHRSMRADDKARAKTFAEWMQLQRALSAMKARHGCGACRTCTFAANVLANVPDDGKGIFDVLEVL